MIPAAAPAEAEAASWFISCASAKPIATLTFPPERKKELKVPIRGASINERVLRVGV